MTASLYTLRKEQTNIENEELLSSKSSNQFARKFFFEDLGIYESCFIILLNNAKKTIGYAKISQGGICGTVVDPTLIAKYAIESLCKGVILVHNHPSGSLEPSSNDDNLTKRIKECLKLFDIVLLDHLILTEESYYSYADKRQI